MTIVMPEKHRLDKGVGARGPALLPQPPQAPDCDRFTKLERDSVLWVYLKSVIEWHGYMRFVSLPHLKDNPDVVISRLFVEPSLSLRPLSSDAPQEDQKEVRAAARKVIEENPRLVILGDPGGGKSTLVNWLAWSLAKYPLSGSEPLSGLIPLPMILRELPIGPTVTWDSLLSAWLSHLMCKPLEKNKVVVEGWLATGQAFVMLDGLDEIGNINTKMALREAVFEGMNCYPKCRFLLTSRIIGYDQMVFDRIVDDPPADKKEIQREIAGFSAMPTTNRETQVTALYFVAPFDDAQVSAFAHNWFNERESGRERAYAGATNLLSAIRSHPTTTRLARTPSLLTMMALIYRVKARLPNGRTLLYNQIAEAYLQSIDTYRGIHELEYPLEQKQRWLARVGFEMQRRRADAKQGNETREILVSGKRVRGWIAEAMAESGYGRDETTAGALVDHIGRRSGLLLPRGEDQFAFMHLSFQEYFAACYIEERITSRRWSQDRTELWEGLNRQTFHTLARETAWRETLIFLAERLAQHREQFEAFLDDLFGPEFNQINPENRDAEPAAVLLATLAVNPHTGFETKLRREAIAACWKWTFRQGEKSGTVGLNTAIPTLFHSGVSQIGTVWEELNKE